MEKIIKFFATKTLFSNIIFVSVFILGVFSWINIGKEEMPSFESDWVRVNAVYPGASSEDVETLVTRPLEDELRGLQGIEEVNSTSSPGVSSVGVTLRSDYPDKKEVVQNIKDVILGTKLPADVEKPSIRQFKSSEKAIIDIGIYIQGSKILTDLERKRLQEQVNSLENQLVNLKEISSVSKGGYLPPEIKVIVNPKKLQRYQISLNQVYTKLRSNHYRIPLGQIKNKEESRVVVVQELGNKEALENVVIRRNYQGKTVTLKDLATIRETYRERRSVMKIQGHEAVTFSVRKSISSDILKAREKVFEVVKMFRARNKEGPIKIKLMDDESYDVTNRLGLISSNGLLGFLFILLFLFLALDFKTGFWVACGIPFSLAVSITLAHIIGYTVNNVTLAAIIILMGVVVDDAIIVAENIERKIESGEGPLEAAVQGSREVFKPILASILTTCVAFIPLFYFQGFFGKLVSYIPLIIVFMLFGSLIESYFVLPNHLIYKSHFLSKVLDKLRFKRKQRVPSLKEGEQEKKERRFHKWEIRYKNFLEKCLNYKSLLLLFFIGILGSSIYFYKAKLKFVMFPREEAKEIYVRATAKENLNRLEMASFINELENIFLQDKTKSVVAVRSRVGVSRRGGQARENSVFMRVEILPLGKRKVKLRSLIKKWEKTAKGLKGFKQVRFIKHRWGRSSGSPIEIRIQENNDEKRKKLADLLKTEMERRVDIGNVELERPLLKKEYLFKINQKEMTRLKVSPSQLTNVLRSFVGGVNLFDITREEETVEVKMLIEDGFNQDIENIYKVKVTNAQGSLISLKRILEIEERKKPLSIDRVNFKRTTMLYADLKKGVEVTPLEIAEDVEKKTFPVLGSQFPASLLSFVGEVKDSRDSRNDFKISILLVALMTYFILVILFNSLAIPLVIVSIIPFGMAGIIFVLLIHKMSMYGFFSIIGTLGMMGVVINDAIVMISKIENLVKKEGEASLRVICEGASTRFRAVVITTVTTVVAILPTAYGFFGYDSMLAEMMLTMGWGLFFSTLITLFLVPCLYTIYSRLRSFTNKLMT